MNGQKRVVVVDDDRDMVRSLCDILEMHGWETLTSFDGEAALNLSNKQGVELFLMDVRMPRMNGVEAWTAIHKQHPRARSVLMTAYAPPEALALTPGHGVIRILRKPVAIPDLIAALEAARLETA